MSSKPIQVDHELEQRLLELAYTTDVALTAPALAYFAPCSIEDAERTLEQLAARDHLRMDVGDDGTVTYQLPGRQHVGSRRRPEPQLLRPAVGYPAVYAVSPLLAAILTIFLPGSGHLYAGRVGAGILWFLVVSAGYALILPGLVLHLFGIASAANAARQVNDRARLALAAGA